MKNLRIVDVPAKSLTKDVRIQVRDVTARSKLLSSAALIVYE
jgi:hypothetical protein